MDKLFFDKSNHLYQYIEEYINSLLDDSNKEDVIYIFSKSIDDLSKTIKFSNDMRSFLIMSRVLKMARGEYEFVIKYLTPEEKKQFVSDKNNLTKLSALVTLKFVILRKSFEEKDIYDVVISSFYPVSTSLNSLMNVIRDFNSKYSKNIPQESLIEDMFQRIFTKVIGTTKMLNYSLASECYVSWRTLHEAECVVKLLCENDPSIKNTYIKHIAYNNALRGGIEDKEELDRIFDQMKKEMREHGLKSKDMKKYIEYGWLYSTVQFNEKDPMFKLNFRDGVEKAAGLSKYNQWYEAASEVTHSSPIFFYSNDKFFLDLSILSIYEVALRVTDIYITYFKDRLNENRKEAILIRTLKKDCDEVLKIIKRRFNSQYQIDDDSVDDNEIAFRKSLDI